MEAPISALLKLKGDCGSLLKGMIIRFITSHTKIPYSNPVMYLFFLKMLIAGYMKKNITVQANAMM
jgi:hypothetical protein